MVAKVDGLLCDVRVPLSRDCTVQLITVDEPEGQNVLWHSTAHILGLALEQAKEGYGRVTVWGSS